MIFWDPNNNNKAKWVTLNFISDIDKWCHEVSKCAMYPFCTSGFSLQWPLYQNPVYFLPLVSIFQGEQMSIWDPGAEMKPCSVSGGQSCKVEISEIWSSISSQQCIGSANWRHVYHESDVRYINFVVECGIFELWSIISRKIRTYKIGTWHFLKLHDSIYQYQK